MNELSIRGANWSFEDLNSNQEEVILLIHGHPFNHSMWKYQYKALDNFRLLVPDLKGYGASDYNFEKIFIEEQALDLAIFLDELQVEKVHLIGLSMGGQIIVEFQRLFPHRAKSLVICASLPNAESEESYINRLNLADSISKIGMFEYTVNDIHKYINLEEVHKGSEEYNHLFKMMSETKAEGAIASHKGRAERRDNSSYVHNITIPTLIIAGEKDYFFNVENIKSLAEKIPNSQLAIMDKSGHLPNLENPEVFNKLVIDFYNEVV